jgi:hypothetical protein
MNRSLFAFLIGLGLYAHSGFAPRAAADSIPQDSSLRLKLERETLEWNKRTLLGAYEKVGRKDERWDAQAREALEVMVRSVSHAEPRPLASEVREAFKKAVDCGCDDPLIVFNNVRYNPLPGEGQDAALADAVANLVKSDYPAVRKATALYVSAARKSPRAKTDPAAAKEATSEVDQALRLLSRSFAKDGAGTALENVWIQNLRNNAVPILKQTLGSLVAANDRVDGALAKVPAAKAVRLTFRGMYLTERAWEIRGNGFADTVSPENAQKFDETLAKAENALREAWAANPRHAWIPTMMIGVLKGLGSERAEMEVWFQRAMALDDRNFAACNSKLSWLSARWHGSHDEVLAFGRACRDTHNLASGIPLLLAQAHLDVCELLPEEKQSDYMRNDKVWSDVRSVYEQHLKVYKQDYAAGSRYAAFCWLSRHYSDAATQFRALGTNLVADRHFSKALLERARDESYARSGTGKAPG